MNTQIAIWNVLHDGEITAVSEDGDTFTLFVSIPYLRRQLKPLGDSFDKEVPLTTHLESGVGPPQSKTLARGIKRPGEIYSKKHYNHADGRAPLTEGVRVCLCFCAAWLRLEWLGDTAHDSH